jgi:hypothetical protein
MILGLLGGVTLAIAIVIASPDLSQPAPFLLGFSLTLLGGLIGKAAS